MMSTFQDIVSQRQHLGSLRLYYIDRYGAVASKRSINYSDADAARPVSLATPVNLPTRHSAYANPKVCVIRAASTLVCTWVGKSWFWGQGSWL